MLHLLDNLIFYKGAHSILLNLVNCHMVAPLLLFPSNFASSGYIKFYPALFCPNLWSGKLISKMTHEFRRASIAAGMAVNDAAIINIQSQTHEFRRASIAGIAGIAVSDMDTLCFWWDNSRMSSKFFEKHT